MIDFNCLSHGTSVRFTPDGKKFVFLLDRLREASPQQVNVVLNWTEELNRVAGR